MRRLQVLIAVIVAAAIGAPAALGDTSSVKVVDLPVHGSRALAASAGPERFTLVGIHWRGQGRVLFRVRSRSGTWSAWRGAAPEQEDGPDPGSAEARGSQGWHIGSPWWVGNSDRIEARAGGQVSRIRAYLVWSPPVGIPIRVPSQSAATSMPTIVPRLSWGADETIRRAPPSYAPALRLAIVHHTAGQNDYTRAEAPAIVKAIELYHVKGNGWNDIGYNFLVDRFGTIYEGRYGGVDKNVVGAHALGFNYGSVGVAVLGTYGSTAPSQAAQDALARLLAWRLDLAHVDPLSLVTYVSGGSERYAAGIPVVLHAISGHRDTGFTECPGDALYARLSSIARAAEALGQPKIYAPLATKNPEDGSVRFQARLSKSLPWTVSVTNSSGSEVVRGGGVGTTVDWTWDAASSSAATYTWSISAGAARPATGTVNAGAAQVPLAIDGASADPSAISPNGDAQADDSLVTFDLTTTATVNAEVADAAGNSVATVVKSMRMGAGEQNLVVDGSTLADGAYTVLVTARTRKGEEAEAAVPLTVSRLLGTVAVTPFVFSPNGDGRLDTLEVGFSLTAAASVTLRISRDGREVASPFVGNMSAGAQTIAWDGSKAGGVLRDGAYEAVVQASDEAGTIAFGVPFVSDTQAPRLKVVSLNPLRVFVSEPAMLRLLVNGKALTTKARRAGVTTVPWGQQVHRVRVVAEDVAGNVSSPANGFRRPGQ